MLLFSDHCQASCYCFWHSLDGQSKGIENKRISEGIYFNVPCTLGYWGTRRIAEQIETQREGSKVKDKRVPM
jgi:hypothetical protein